MKKLSNLTKTNFLNRIIDYIEKEDNNGLIEYCNEIGIKINSEINQKQLYYKIVSCIENDEKILLDFKQKAKEDVKFHILIPYFKENENIRFFNENKKDYNISENIINLVRENFQKRKELERKEIEDSFKRREMSLLNIFGLIIITIIAFSGAIKIIYPKYLTHINKEAKTTMATVIKLNTNQLSHHLVYDVDISYEYFVDDNKYIANKSTVVGSSRYFTMINEDKIEIYYYCKDPSKSDIYKKYSDFTSLVLILDAFLFLASTIIQIKKRRELKNIKE